MEKGEGREGEPAAALPSPLMTLASHGVGPALVLMQPRRRAQTRVEAPGGPASQGRESRPESGLRALG